MNWPPEYIQEVALKIASAEREAREEAAKETDPQKKLRLLADAERLKTAYEALHGVGS